ncbi:sulfotransferase family protein [Flavimaricola sp.]|nr:sulfotransferase family protein [Flavimaricola sp.]
MRPIVHLHMPKTAGQAIHHELTRCVGKRSFSPIRVHSAVPNGTTNLPQCYLLHSGHIDGLDIDTLPPDRFVFSVLRDPLERIASFYFCIFKEAKA